MPKVKLVRNIPDRRLFSSVAEHKEYGKEKQKNIDEFLQLIDKIDSEYLSISDFAKALQKPVVWVDALLLVGNLKYTFINGIPMIAKVDIERAAHAEKLVDLIIVEEKHGRSRQDSEPKSE